MQTAYDYLQQNATLIFDDIKRLVQAQSPSLNKEATDLCGETLQRIVFERLGVTAQVCQQQTLGDHLLFCVGDGPQVTSILGHFDTVWDIDEIPMLEKDGKLFGPGVLDMKAGLIQSIWAVRALMHNGGLAQHSIRFICPSDEELGSPSSRRWIEQSAIGSSRVLVAEPAVVNTHEAKIGRKGSGRFEVRITGRAAHAGNNPEEGISAVQEMAHQILYLHGLNAPEAGTTVNVGVAKGGSKINVVADEAVLGVDLRVTNTGEAARVEAAIKACKPHLAGAEVTVSGGMSRPPMEPTPQNLALFHQAQQAAKRLGVRLEGKSVGGGSDGNFTSALGIATLDGLGATGQGIHARHEHIIIDDIPLRTALLAEIILGEKIAG
ncbi:M20 family metallopeptidase [Rouxiella badensis]|jgi:glutamate carboxypeptidase|uniref:Peptidase M20 n=1 Tax=Rouxiella badensis TaxID=1646377 RepID=A0A1X0WEY7_9GAMM|nr:M20 family metallopeptidase [Rouxiella badensis]MCC3703810.1 M20 family metallopeptidase [Rouxiella badensis]MCC3719838.1 M20 family metallopeptidase [Rouxiella badensis]MCC3729310.1 M20 family metallopeptidase [Rouxiella badensis]MCC3734726.1 M20 family metallopeptidase [Rouxiella badensis]MCC3741477.1 M20 family metallopeptidase [Rouxiella badensis]